MNALLGHDAVLLGLLAPSPAWSSASACAAAAPAVPQRAHLLLVILWAAVVARGGWNGRS